MEKKSKRVLESHKNFVAFGKQYTIFLFNATQFNKNTTKFLFFLRIQNLLLLTK